jgi:diaminopimelate decarboxylase
VRYPVKANPSTLRLEAIAGWGGAADCASRPEVHAALAAGIPMDRISYESPAPNVDYAVWLLRRGATVVVDSQEILAAIEQGMQDGAMKGRLFVRVNSGQLPGYLEKGEHQHYTAHGDARSQFGIPSEDLVQALAATQIPVTGLHVHVGTMMDNLEAFVDGLEFLHALADRIHATTLHRPNSINLGGGLGLPHDRTQSHPTIRALGLALKGHLRAGFCYEV